MWFVEYKISDFGKWSECQFDNEADAMTEALELLKTGYIVQVNEE